ncbi:MAG: DUF6526 family protein [Ferruginibacter sp.]
MQEQNFKNHTRFVPLYHYVAFALIGILIISSLIRLYKSYVYNFRYLWVPGMFLIISIVLLLLAWYARVFAIKAQDRAIRAEENLRYYAITGNLLDPKLTMSQIVALRFAPNNELLELAHRAVKENLSAKDIKKAIKDWKADHHRA